jgi:hypothetical protein
VSAGRNTLKGLFHPINPEKYKGDHRKIVYRSSWELQAMSRFDKDVRIVWWSSEEMCVQYYNPVKQREARYFPDFIIGVGQANGLIRKIMIEVKPDGECRPPIPPKNRNAKRRHRFICETATFAINQAKWEAARKFCEKHGMHFQIMTEYELGLKKRKA